MEAKGLTYIEDFLSEEEATELINIIDANTWDNTLKRRTQHYGYRYNYNHINKDQSAPVEEIPKELISLFGKLRSHNLASDIDIKKLQVIINEYEAGQGIGAHIDDPKRFGDWIISVSLNSDCMVIFTNKANKSETIKMRIKKNSVYQMTKDSRYKWTHQINGVKIDHYNDCDYVRDRRISVTFRIMK